MTHELIADFEKRFPNGATIQFASQIATNSFSVTVLFGPSGCGKTTVLRCLAGLERPEDGRIECAGQVWFDAGLKIHESPQSRDIGFLFQDYALFPHLNVEKNIAFGLRGMARSEIHQSVQAMLTRFQLEGLEHRYPHQLSGGQQQRVALSRATVRKPKLLLLDEPLSALDGVTREELRGQLRGLLLSAGVPVIMVTHDVIEAVALADHVIVMDQGQVKQQGPVEEVFSRPVDARVARIVGVETVVRGRVASINQGMAAISIGPASLSVVATLEPGTEVDLFIRAQDVALVRTQTVNASVQNHLTCRVTAVIPEGALSRVLLDCGFALTALITKRAHEELDLKAGDAIIASIKATAIQVCVRSQS